MPSNDAFNKRPMYITENDDPLDVNLDDIDEYAQGRVDTI